MNAYYNGNWTKLLSNSVFFCLAMFNSIFKKVAGFVLRVFEKTDGLVWDN
jgi:hypothetical protein